MEGKLFDMEGWGGQGWGMWEGKGQHARMPVKFEVKFHTGYYVRMGEGENVAYLWEG